MSIMVKHFCMSLPVSPACMSAILQHSACMTKVVGYFCMPLCWVQRLPVAVQRYDDIIKGAKSHLGLSRASSPAVV